MRVSWTKQFILWGVTGGIWVFGVGNLIASLIICALILNDLLATVACLGMTSNQFARYATGNWKGWEWWPGLSPFPLLLSVVVGIIWAIVNYLS